MKTTNGLRRPKRADQDVPRSARVNGGFAGFQSQASSRSYAATVIDDRPAGYWRLEFDGRDSVGRNNGTVVQTVTFGQLSALSDKSFGASFDGVAGQISVPTAFGGTSLFSMECWAKVNGNSQGSFVKTGGFPDGIGIGIGGSTEDLPGTQLLGLYEQKRWLVTGYSMPNGWHHLVLVIDANGFPTMYCDGMKVYTDVTGTPNAGGSPLYIGGYNSGGNPRFFNGPVDEVAVYNYTLTAQQVANHYNAR